MISRKNPPSGNARTALGTSGEISLGRIVVRLKVEGLDDLHDLRDLDMYCKAWQVSAHQVNHHHLVVCHPSFLEAALLELCKGAQFD